MAIIVFLPLEDHIPTVAGLSFSWLLFGIVALYVAFNRVMELTWVARSPLAFSCYLFIIISILMETISLEPQYAEIGRIGQMMVGAALVATLCRDRRALRVGVYSFLAEGAWLSVLLVLTVYGRVSGIQTGDFDAATGLREEIFNDYVIELNLNTMAFIASQGAAVSLALALTTRSTPARLLYLGSGLLCTVGAFLPFSRSGIIIACASCGAVVAMCRGRRVTGLIMATVLGIGILMCAPAAILSRMDSSMEKTDKMEGRARVYTAVIDHLPEYVLIGVGAGNFRGSWGQSSEFFTGDGGTRLLGSHNCFIQVTIYWGIPGLLSLCFVVWQAYWCVPRARGDDALTLAMMAIALSVFLLLLTTHDLYLKQFSLALGLMVGVRCWGAVHRH